MQSYNKNYAKEKEMMKLFLDGDNYFRILVDNNGTLYTEQVNIK
ncbi:MAG TPA: hypothetical protein PKN32_03300 [Bacteroidales bacterium]|nr:hypothetical protein [Bacteroidales bacterium]